MSPAARMVLGCLQRAGHPLHLVDLQAWARYLTAAELLDAFAELQRAGLIERTGRGGGRHRLTRKGQAA